MGCSGDSVSVPGVVFSGEDVFAKGSAVRVVKAFVGSEGLRLKEAFSAQMAHWS